MAAVGVSLLIVGLFVLGSLIPRSPEEPLYSVFARRH